ncbi:hypothetical protein ACH518_20785 [Methylomonas sp. HW2-6]|uniref:hypothetical protein n=1 Tax=Methylomonas sp. HW2-6 TaxID=3376687 RepID=UPI004040F7A3
MALEAVAQYRRLGFPGEAAGGDGPVPAGGIDAQPLQQTVAAFQSVRLLGAAVVQFRRVYRLKAQLVTFLAAGLAGLSEAGQPLEQGHVVGDETHAVAVRRLPLPHDETAYDVAVIS